MDHPSLARRSSGILLHPTSLPGPFEFGDIGSEARRFVGLLRETGQSWWQMCPLNPPRQNGSPYDVVSAFAGNPALIDLDDLIAEGLLEASEVGKSNVRRSGEFAAHLAFKLRCLDAAFLRFQTTDQSEFRKFKVKNAYWLEDYVLFSALRKHYSKKPWTDWPAPIRRRDADFLKRVRDRLSPACYFFEFVQYVFFKQLSALKRFCQDKGVGLIGDSAFYVGHDSADVWAHQNFFDLDSKGKPASTGGTPPDLFSQDGQNWGMPPYRWDEIRQDGYRWWIERFKTAFQSFDAVRLDHFIGFARFWRIPATAKTATEGAWVPGPGEDFFNAVLEEIPSAQFVAEDLGALAEDVERLRDRFSFPGMKVLQFAFSSDTNAPKYRPESHNPNSVVYTGTHDNNTSSGWYADLQASGSSDPQNKQALELLRSSLNDQVPFHVRFIEMAFGSKSNVAIIPFQDVLGLGAEARFNNPYGDDGNWKWRFQWSQVSAATKDMLKTITEKSGRLAQP